MAIKKSTSADRIIRPVVRPWDFLLYADLASSVFASFYFSKSCSGAGGRCGWG